jgi:hypothetical protein
MHFSSFDALRPTDLAILRKVLEEVCAERNIAIDKEDAEAIAHDLVNWYLFGVKDPDKLREMLKPL